MLSIFDGLRGVDFLSVFVRIVIACVCGAAVGLDRSAKNRPAGFRTHMLVCLGSTVASLTGVYLYLEANLPSDVSRISSQVISGLGFIGAGTIVVTKKRTVKGLTAAAGLWTTGIVGLAIGSGYYELGLLGAAMVLITESLLSLLNSRIHHHPEYTVELSYREKTYLDDVLRLCKNHRMAITNLRIHTMDSAGKDLPKYTAEVEMRGNTDSKVLLELIQQMPGVVSAAIQ